MDLHCKLLLYLDKRRFLVDMKTKCQSFLEDFNDNSLRFPPLRYLLQVDVMDILNLFPDLGDFLLKEPLKWQRICDAILFACLQTVNDACHNIAIDFSQVAVTIRPRCVPHVLNTNPHNFSGLVHFRGLLLAVTNPTSYVYHTVWSCPEECEGNEVILHHIPKVPPKCYICKSILFENSGLKRCGEHATATFLLNDNILTKKFTITDDLIPKLTLGSHYDLIVVILKKVTSLWYIEELVGLPAPITTSIPTDIADLYRACNGLPWTFIYCLASSIAVNVCPLNCFIQVKISLLLSLASVKANRLTNSKIIHVLVASFDSRYVGEIMTEAAKLADRSVLFGTNATTSTSLIASSGGVCVMPLPLHCYNQKQTSSILTAIECDEVATDTGRAKLKSAVWARGMDFKKILLFNVANVFGTVCRGDLGEYNDEVVDFILEKAIEPEDVSKEEVKALDDLKSYLDLVAGVEISMEDRTERLLRCYFLAARREMSKGVSVGNMGALVVTCLTSARLCGRAVANIDDAVFAIWLHIGGSPEPRVAPEEYLRPPADVKRLNKTIDNFKNWLEQFTGCMIHIL